MDMLDSIKKAPIVAKIFVAFLLGGGGPALFVYLQKSRSFTQEELSLIINTLREDLREKREYTRQMEEINRNCNQQVLELRERVYLLERANVYLNSSTQSFPLPAWIKDTKSIMISCNAEYVKTFLEPEGLSAEDYIGRDDYCCWPDSIAAKFIENDQEVIRQRKRVTFTEEVLYNGRVEEWTIYKYPRFAGETVIAIEGFAIPKND